MLRLSAPVLRGARRLQISHLDSALLLLAAGRGGDYEFRVAGSLLLRRCRVGPFVVGLLFVSLRADLLARGALARQVRGLPAAPTNATLLVLAVLGARHERGVASCRRCGSHSLLIVVPVVARRSLGLFMGEAGGSTLCYRLQAAAGLPIHVLMLGCSNTSRHIIDCNDLLRGYFRTRRHLSRCCNVIIVDSLGKGDLLLLQEGLDRAARVLLG